MHSNHQPGYYKFKDPDQIIRLISDEGFDPLLISDPPGRLYPPHSHPEIKLLAIVKGSMKVTMSGETFSCGPSDRLLIPGNIEHAAQVGPDGCTFFWSERLA